MVRQIAKIAVMGMLLSSAVAASAPAGDAQPSSSATPGDRPRVSIEFAPHVPPDAGKATQLPRAVHATIHVDGTEVTHLEGRGMEHLYLVADGDGRRMVCGSALEQSLGRRRGVPDDFRRPPAATGENDHALR